MRSARPVRGGLLAAGAAALGAVWLWPLPQLPLPPFTLHMAQHMAVVALAAPLLALGLAGSRLDPVPRAPTAVSAIPASMVELVAVWAWHAPALHRAARTAAWAHLLEQGTFLLAGLYLWGAALGGGAALRRSRATGGVTGLLLTSMHMTLLGALLTLSPRLLFDHGEHGHHGAMLGLSALQDQHLGGAVMILAGGAAYLVGAVALTADALGPDSAGSRNAETQTAETQTAETEGHP